MQDTSQFYRANPTAMHAGYHDGQWVNTLLLAILVVLVGLGVYFFYKYSSRISKNGSNIENPKEITQNRLAKGEISQSEYDEIIKKIS